MIWDIPHVFNSDGSINKECEWVFNDWAFPMLYIDGPLCLFQEDHLYREYFADPTKRPPLFFFLGQEGLLKNGKYGGWRPVFPDKKKDEPFRDAFTRLMLLAAASNKTFGTSRPLTEGLYTLAGTGKNRGEWAEPTLLHNAALSLKDLGIPAPRSPDPVFFAVWFQDHPEADGICYWNDFKDQNCRKALVLRSGILNEGGIYG